MQADINAVVQAGTKIFNLLLEASDDYETRLSLAQRQYINFLTEYPLVGAFMCLGIYDSKAFKMMIQKIRNTTANSQDEYIDIHGNYLKYLYMCKNKNYNQRVLSLQHERGKEMLQALLSKPEETKQSHLSEEKQRLLDNIYKYEPQDS